MMMNTAMKHASFNKFTISFGYTLYCVCFNLYCGCFNLFCNVRGGGLVTCILAFTGFVLFLCCFVYEYLFSFVLSVTVQTKQLNCSQ